MDDVRIPPGGPAFLKPEVAQSLDYPGDPGASKLYDHELDSLVPDDNGVFSDVAPKEGYRIRYDRVAYLHAQGLRNNEIAEHLNYSQNRISIVLRHPYIMERTEHYRSQLHDTSDLANRIKLFAEDSISYLHGTLRDPTVKDEVKSANARWGMEKHSGKAKQEVQHESHTFSAFMDMLKNMQSRGEALDVTPKEQPAIEGQAPEAAQQINTWDTWLDANLAR